jgi:peptidoglycan hydrolase-like protein with peptidoglycan-binding domain
MFLCVVYTTNSYFVFKHIDIYEPGVRGAVKANEEFSCVGATDTCYWYGTWEDQGHDDDITTFSEVNSIYYPSLQKGMMYVDIIYKIENPVSNSREIQLRTYDSTITVFAPTYQDFINFMTLFP